MTSASRTILSATMLAAALLVTSCGSATISASDPTVVAGSSTTADGTDDGSSTSTSGPRDVTTTPETTRPDTTRPDTAGNDFCTAITDVEELFQPDMTGIDLTDPDPEKVMAQMRELMQRASDQFDAITATAPAEIRDDFELIAGYFSDSIAQMQEADSLEDWDTLFSGLEDDTTKLSEAAQNIEDYLMEHCGVGTSVPD